MRISLNTSNDPIKVAALAVVLLAAGGFLTAYGYGEYGDQRGALADAEEVEATVVDTEIRRYRSGGSDDDGTTANDDDAEFEYRLTVEYEYDYGGETYRGSRIDLGTDWLTFDDRDEAEAARRSRFGEGSRVTAHVDPARPGEAFLEARVPPSTYLITGFGALLVLGAVRMIGLFLVRR